MREERQPFMVDCQRNRVMNLAVFFLRPDCSRSSDPSHKTRAETPSLERKRPRNHGSKHFLIAYSRSCRLALSLAHVRGVGLTNERRSRPRNQKVRHRVCDDFLNALSKVLRPKIIAFLQSRVGKRKVSHEILTVRHDSISRNVRFHFAVVGSRWPQSRFASNARQANRTAFL